MGQWHWYCDTHGQIDRTVQVESRTRVSGGRCTLCGRRANWDERPAVRNGPSQQLLLFGDRP
jgi:hypothetical protein